MFHASRETTGKPFPEGLYLPVNGFYKVIILTYCCSEDGGIELQVLLHGQIRVEAEAAGHVTDMIPQFPEIAHHIEPEKVHPSAGGDDQGCRDAEEGCLARSVGTNEAEELTLPDGE